MTSADIAVVGFAQAPHVRETNGTTNGVEMLVPCFQQLYSDLGITKSDIGFWCSGSSDYRRSTNLTSRWTLRGPSTKRGSRS